jgi:hypothetical protein
MKTKETGLCTRGHQGLRSDSTRATAKVKHTHDTWHLRVASSGCQPHLALLSKIRLVACQRHHQAGVALPLQLAHLGFQRIRVSESFSIQSGRVCRRRDFRILGF